jgi:predicted small lipoprotein YifL
MADSRPIRATLLATLLWALAGCGQKGPLYLPDPSGEVVTRPAAESTASPDGATSNSPQTVDSPLTPASPAPEVTAPEGSDDDKEPGTAAPAQDPDS